MILKSFGCSFIFGTDLADSGPTPGRGEPYETSTKSTWPALLAQHLGCEYQCYARPGSGNLRILEKILSQCDRSTQSELFVIGWTWIDRFDYTTTPSFDSHCYDLAGDNLWQTVTPSDRDGRAKNYYRDLHSQYRDKLSSLIYVKTAIDMLIQKHIPFVMTYVDDLLFESQWHANDAVLCLQQQIKPYMTTFEGQTFLEWSKQKGFPISETLHPLESAHQAAFELIRSYNLV